jgi:pyruvate ferredoxin oxidoreductase delta subunit
MEKGAVTKHDLKKAPKTGEWRYMKPEVDEKKCIGCGTCVKFCPEAVIDLMNLKEIGGKESAKIRKVAEIDYEFCKGCGVCANVCPVKAIRMVSSS